MFLRENAGYKETDGDDDQHHCDGDTVSAHSGARDPKGQEEDRGPYQGALGVELGCEDTRMEKDKDKDKNEGKAKQRQNGERVDFESLRRFHSDILLLQRGTPLFYHGSACLSSIGEIFLWRVGKQMTVDDLIFTFAEGHEDKLPYLVKRIDPGAVYALKRARAVAEFKAVRQNLCTLT